MPYNPLGGMFIGNEFCVEVHIQRTRSDRPGNAHLRWCEKFDRVPKYYKDNGIADMNSFHEIYNEMPQLHATAFDKWDARHRSIFCLDEETIYLRDTPVASLWLGSRIGEWKITFDNPPGCKKPSITLRLRQVITAPDGPSTITRE